MENSSHFDDNGVFVPDPRADMELVEDINVRIGDRVEIFKREYEEAKRNLSNLEESLGRYQRRVERAEQELADVKASRAKYYRDPKGKLPPSDTEYRIKLEEARDMVEEIEELIKDAQVFVNEARDKLDNEFWLALHGQDGVYKHYRDECIAAMQRVLDLNSKWEIAVTTLKRREGRRLFHTAYEKDPFNNSLKVLPIEMYRDLTVLVDGLRREPGTGTVLHQQYEVIGSLPGDDDWVEPRHAVPPQILKDYKEEQLSVREVEGFEETFSSDSPASAPVVAGLRRLSESEGDAIRERGDVVNLSEGRLSDE